jgi:hypothetical protein
LVSAKDIMHDVSITLAVTVPDTKMLFSNALKKGLSID